MPRRGPSGAIYGFQLWVNLPAALKMTTPRYQEVSAATIPSAEKDGATVRIVTGEVFGVKGPVTEIAASPLYIDVTLAPGAEFVQETPLGHTVIAYVFEGEGAFGELETGSEAENVSSVKMVVFADGDHIRVKAADNSPVRFMLMAGAPFKEPIVPYGPFVMNTMDEIKQTLADLRSGAFIQQ
jgi:redox-sensitive bicupin YhaK (pirin superfamily)